MKVRSLNHVGLTVSSFKNSVRWYHEMFGLSLVSDQVIDRVQAAKLYNLYGLGEVDIKLGFLKVPGGGVIEIFEFSPAAAAQKICWNRPGPTHFTMDVKDITRWYNKLKHNHVEILCEPQNTNGTEWFFMKDPDGNLIELIDLKTNYRILKFLGSIVGWAMARGKYKKYYED